VVTGQDKKPDEKKQGEWSCVLELQNASIQKCPIVRSNSLKGVEKEGINSELFCVLDLQHIHVFARTIHGNQAESERKENQKDETMERINDHENAHGQSGQASVCDGEIFEMAADRMQSSLAD
jgi:CRISPR/Cas system CMR subunit Cmr4 (Cas7 group RAMP superfamily)